MYFSFQSDQKDFATYGKKSVWEMDCRKLDLSPPVVIVNDDEVRVVLACVRRWFRRWLFPWWFRRLGWIEPCRDSWRRVRWRRGSWLTRWIRRSRPTRRTRHFRNHRTDCWPVAAVVGPPPENRNNNKNTIQFRPCFQFDYHFLRR